MIGPTAMFAFHETAAIPVLASPHGFSINMTWRRWFFSATWVQTI
jgi:hypothetical protein